MKKERTYKLMELNAKILIADENLEQRNFLKENLYRAGYRNVEIATNGDVNGDGEIDVMDASYIRRFAVKLIAKFPVEEK